MIEYLNPWDKSIHRYYYNNFCMEITTEEFGIAPSTQQINL